MINSCFLKCWVALLALALLANGCATAPAVTRHDGTQSAPESTVSYSLPRTLLALSVPVKRIRRTGSQFSAEVRSGELEQRVFIRELLLRGVDPGEFRYYEKLGEEDFGLQEDLYSIDYEKVVVSTAAEADPKNTFVVHLSAHGFQDIKFDFSFGKDGILKSASLTSTNQSIPWLLKAVDVATKVVIAKTGPKPATVPFSKIPTLQRLFDELDEIIDKEAQLVTAASANGGAHSADGFAAALDLLAKQKAPLLDRLLGKKTETVITVTLYDVPPERIDGAVADEEKGIYTARMFQLTPSTGIEYLTPATRNPLPFASTAATLGQLAAADYPSDGFNYTPKPRPDKVVTGLVQLRQQTPIVKAPAFNGSGGLVYRRPVHVTADFCTQTGDKLVAKDRRDLVIAQWGELRRLPRKLGGVSGTIAVTLDPDTGAMQTLAVGSTTLAANSVDAAVTSVLAAQAADPELKAAQREAALKKAQFESEDFQRKIDEAAR